MAWYRWTLTDPADSTTYVFEINPNAGGSPDRKRTLTPQATTAADGAPIVFEGETPPATSQASGVLHTQAQYDAFKIWYQKRRIIQLQDDLGRIYHIYITAFKPTSAYSRPHLFRMKYTISYVVVDTVLE